jgi:hypothetical protein
MRMAMMGEVRDGDRSALGLRAKRAMVDAARIG